MTRKVGRSVVIEVEAAQRCEFCDRVAETRPYGPGGKRICFPCMKGDPKLEAEAERQFKALLDGTD